MKPETLAWIARRVMAQVRAGDDFPEPVAYELGGMPFVDAIRKEVLPPDKHRLLRLIQSEDWWSRYLGTNIARPILDEEIAEIVRGNWQDEEHFHTRLAKTYLLMHAGLDEEEIAWVVADLEKHVSDFMPCIFTFYGSPEATAWAKVAGRLADNAFGGATPIYLLVLALLTEQAGRALGPLPGSLEQLTESKSVTISGLAQRLARLADTEGVN